MFFQRVTDGREFFFAGKADGIQHDGGIAKRNGCIGLKPFLDFPQGPHPLQHHDEFAGNRLSKRNGNAFDGRPVGKGQRMGGFEAYYQHIVLFLQVIG